MKLSQYDEKHVRVKSIYGDTFTGVADYYSSDYCRDEFGVDEDAVKLLCGRNDRLQRQDGGDGREDDFS